MSKRSGGLCCVEGCKTKPGKKEPGVQMYRFPGKPHELELKKRWVKAVKRGNNGEEEVTDSDVLYDDTNCKEFDDVVVTNSRILSLRSTRPFDGLLPMNQVPITFIKSADGSNWQPKSWSRVCSKHFINGKKSNIHDHPCSVPSIFPWTTRIAKADVKAQLEKVKEILERSRNVDDEEHNLHGGRMETSLHPEKPTRDVKTQVMMALDQDDIPEFTLEFFRDDKNNAGVQCKISYHLDRLEKETKIDAGCDPINPRLLRGGFLGFSSIASETQLLDMTGLMTEGFGKLVDLFHENLSKTLQNETVLLMFLMKLRLDLSYKVLSVFFQVSHITAKLLILKTMNLLYVKTKRCLSWPVEIVERLEWNMNEVIRSEQQFYLGHKILHLTDCRKKSSFKFLIGVSEEGKIIFKSGGYDGTSSCGFVTTDCGFMEMLEPQDMVITSAPLDLPGSENGQVFPDIVSPPFTDLFQTGTENRMLIVARHSEVCCRKLKAFKFLNHLHDPSLQLLNECLHVCCVIANLMPTPSMKSCYS